MCNLPDDIINKIIMCSIPHYPFLEELKLTRFIREGCDCEGCEYKPHYGCYDFLFNSIEHKRGQDCYILCLSTSTQRITYDDSDDSYVGGYAAYESDDEFNDSDDDSCLNFQ